MRIDYVLTSACLAPLIQSATVHGKGKERDGFLGSDHCPLTLIVTPGPPPTPPPPAAAPADGLAADGPSCAAAGAAEPEASTSSAAEAPQV